MRNFVVKFIEPSGMGNSSHEFVAQVGDQADEKLTTGHLDDAKPVFHL